MRGAGNEAVIAAFCIFIFASALLPAAAQARRVAGVVGKGEAVVVGITPEEGMLIALQRARADAIEKAVGVNILGTTLVTDGRLVCQFLKAFSRGFILDESKEMSMDYLKDSPTPRYCVTVTATVLIPEKQVPADFVFTASLNKGVFLAGETAALRARVSRAAHIGVFNLRADDRIVMLYPNRYTSPTKTLEPNIEWFFPQQKSGLVLAVETLPGHERDSEAFFVVAIQADGAGSNPLSVLFDEGREYQVPEFFDRYAKIAEHASEQILPYEVVKLGND